MEGCGKASEAAQSLKLTAADAKSLGIIERIISEENLGKQIFYDRFRKLLLEEITVLSRDPELVSRRYERFRRIGTDAVHV